MSRETFHVLLQKYLDGTCSPQERELVNQWYELLDDEGLLLKQTEDLSLVEDRIWQRIQADINRRSSLAAGKQKYFGASLPNFYKWVAAMLIVVAGVSWYAVYHQSATTLTPASVFHIPQGESFYVKANKTDTSQILVLSDGSRIQLQPHSSLSYLKQFASEKREVYLEGAATFVVTKNPSRPFLVYTGAIITQVLGTSFTVKKENSHFEVAVLTGKVAVYEEGSKQLHNKGGVVITPNEKVTYYSDNHHFIASLVENPVVVQEAGNTIAEKEPFSFDEAQMSDVISRLEANYAVPIITENEALNRCLFSGNLSGESLYSMLDIICQAIGANYEIRGTSIILTGNGCD